MIYHRTPNTALNPQVAVQYAFSSVDLARSFLRRKVKGDAKLMDITRLICGGLSICVKYAHPRIHASLSDDKLYRNALLRYP